MFDTVHEVLAMLEDSDGITSTDVFITPPSNTMSLMKIVVKKMEGEQSTISMAVNCMLQAQLQSSSEQKRRLSEVLIVSKAGARTRMMIQKILMVISATKTAAHTMIAQRNASATSAVEFYGACVPQTSCNVSNIP